MAHNIPKNDAQWREKLDELTYEVTRRKATEPPFSGQYNAHFEDGVYRCVCCGHPLFDSESKFDAGCGWPSFTQPLQEGAVSEQADFSHGMQRVEITCSHCDAHLGHVFPDGPAPGGLRYCINSVSLTFIKNDESK